MQFSQYCAVTPVCRKPASNFCVKCHTPEQEYDLVVYSEESNIMWDSVWYLLHLQSSSFLELITSVPQLFAQEDADIWDILP